MNYLVFYITFSASYGYQTESKVVYFEKFPSLEEVEKVINASILFSDFHGISGITPISNEAAEKWTKKAQ